MNRYIALLRGINVSGKNKIAMAELKTGFEALGFSNVSTCLNSGNVTFSGGTGDPAVLSARISAMIQDRFALDIPVFVISQEELNERLENAPEWWGGDDKEQYDNLIFLLPPLTYGRFYEELGDPKAGYERARPYKDVVFWSFRRKDYQKTSWWSKTAGAGVGRQITIRTANAARKLARL